MSEAKIDGGARVGHVHLKVANLERALGFYSGVLGFELMQRFGDSAAFVSAGGYHHHIGLNTWESKGGRAPAPGTTGLYHVAIVYPTRALLGDALQRLMRAGIQLDGAADHGVSEALYLRDPDGNGVEAAAVCLVEAVLFWQLTRIAESHPTLVRPAVGLFVLANVGHALLMARYFFTLPLVFDLLAPASGWAP